MKKTIGLLCGILLFNNNVIAQILDVTVPSISLGVVNGEVVNGRVEIQKVLSNPILLSVNQKELDLPLDVLFVKNTSLIKQHQGDVSLLVDSGNQIETQITLSLWLDGRKVALYGKQSGTLVQFDIPSTFERLEMKATAPLTITLPKSYRGVFDFTLDIEGLSE